MEKFTVYSGMLAVMLSFLSCEPDWGNVAETIVVEGWIESGGNPVVILSKPIKASTHEVSLDDCIVATAKVTVSDGDTCVVLSGGLDHNYFPPYNYISSHIEGVPGKTYTLDIYYNDTHFSAVTTIPETCEIFSVEPYCISDSTKYGILVSFPYNSSDHNWYQFFVKTKGKETRYYPSVWGFVDSWSFNVLTTALDTAFSNNMNGRIVHKLYPGRHVLGDEEYRMSFEKDDTVQIKLATMDSVSSVIWQGFQKVEVTSKLGLFSIVERLDGNIPGAKGYWCGFGVSRSNTIIGK